MAWCLPGGERGIQSGSHDTGPAEDLYAAAEGFVSLA
jgi:hypothetical protein